MEDDKLQAVVPEPDQKEDRDPRAPVQRATPPEPRGLDPRFRRGSLGPMPISAPLAENASSASFHAHLVQLLDAQRADAASSDALDPITPHEDIERQPDHVRHHHRVDHRAGLARSRPLHLRPAAAAPRKQSDRRTTHSNPPEVHDRPS